MNCRSETELKTALERIMRSGTDSADHLRHLASKALQCGVQPSSMDDVDAYLDNLTEASAGSIALVKRMLLDNTQYVLPSIYFHGSCGKIALEWKCNTNVDVLLLIDTNHYEYFKILNDKMSVHRPYIAYASGPIEENIGKNLPKSS